MLNMAENLAAKQPDELNRAERESTLGLLSSGGHKRETTDTNFRRAVYLLYPVI